MNEFSSENYIIEKKFNNLSKPYKKSINIMTSYEYKQFITESIIF
jgi:hypothetical protein